MKQQIKEIQDYINIKIKKWLKLGVL
jgi:hypothetical protein